MKPSVLLALALLLAAGGAEGPVVRAFAVAGGQPAAAEHPPALPRAETQKAQSAQSNASYDEQMGMTFTQNFTGMAYNVTAVQQSGAGGYGPAYLLNGLSDRGYWYQVGLSWNWNPGYYPGTGFDMVYEVWNASGSSVLPSGGGGGLASLSGQVKQGDIVLLSLNFTGGGTVLMRVSDMYTGASASVSYPAKGATHFAGSSYSPSNSKGFFTGLMTEEYHTAPYYGNEAPVRYTDKSFALDSAWMWIDEFRCLDAGCSSTQLLFGGSTSGPVPYTDPTQLHGYSLEGATEYSNAYGLVTGNMNLVPVTASFGPANGQPPKPGPTFTFTSEGRQQSVYLGTTPATYYVDNGSQWSVSKTFPGSGKNERWSTDGQTSGTAVSPLDMVVTYYDQFLVSFVYSVSGGGSGYSAPLVTFYQYGRAQGATAGGAGINEWADAGSAYHYAAELAGSGGEERWASASGSGSVLSSGNVSAVYYHQYAVVFGYSVAPGSAGSPLVAVNFSSFGAAGSLAVQPSGTRAWADAGARYWYPQDMQAAVGGARWHTYSQASGFVVGQLSESPLYYEQFYVQVSSDAGAGGTLYTQGGWYNASQRVGLVASASPGWRLAGWSGDGMGSYTGNATAGATITVDGPVKERAVFEPGLTVTAGAGVTVRVGYGGGVETVAAGSTRTIYLPLGSSVSLDAEPALFLYSFGAWGGAASGSSHSVTLEVRGPVAVTASSTYSAAAIGTIVAVALLSAALAYRLLRGREGQG